MLGGGPVQAVSVGHVGLAITFEAQNGKISGIGPGTHTGENSRNMIWLPEKAGGGESIEAQMGYSSGIGTSSHTGEDRYAKST